MVRRLNVSNMPVDLNFPYFHKFACSAHGKDLMRDQATENFLAMNRRAGAGAGAGEGQPKTLSG